MMWIALDLRKPLLLAPALRFELLEVELVAQILKPQDLTMRVAINTQKIVRMVLMRTTIMKIMAANIMIWQYTLTRNDLHICACNPALRAKAAKPFRCHLGFAQATNYSALRLRPCTPRQDTRSCNAVSRTSSFDGKDLHLQALCPHRLSHSSNWSENALTLQKRGSRCHKEYPVAPLHLGFFSGLDL